MSAQPAQIWMAIDGPLVRMKVAGRADFAAGARFRALIEDLCQRGHRRFLFDVSECRQMDSTFLGLMTGLGMRCSREPPGGFVQLLNPNERILDLLQTLGVAHLFETIRGQPLDPASLNALPMGPGGGPVALTEASLEAHQTLMQVQPANVPKFQDVARFLAEDLKRANR